MCVGVGRLYLFFLGLLVEPVDYVQQCELRCDVGPCFHSALCINGATHIAEVAQKVEGIEHAYEVSVHEAFGDACVPHEVVGVH